MNSSASSTASEDGADTELTTGIPYIAAFWTISKPALPIGVPTLTSENLSGRIFIAFSIKAIKSAVNQTLDKEYYEIIVVKNFNDDLVDDFINNQAFFL